MHYCSRYPLNRRNMFAGVLDSLQTPPPPKKSPHRNSPAPTDMLYSNNLQIVHREFSVRPVITYVSVFEIYIEKLSISPPRPSKKNQFSCTSDVNVLCGQYL